MITITEDLKLKAAWADRLDSLKQEYDRLQKLIDDSFAREKSHNSNALERIPVVIKQCEVKLRIADIEALLDGKFPPL